MKSKSLSGLVLDVDMTRELQASNRQEECRRQLAVTIQRKEELQALRKGLIQRLYERVFTLEVEPLSREDTGEGAKSEC